MTRLQQERERQGLSRSALARKAEMHPATIGQIESRYIGRPYGSQLKKLALALEWSGTPDELLEEASSDDQ